MARKIRKRKIKKSIPLGLAHIHSTFNNTIVTITDPDGNAIAPTNLPVSIGTPVP